MPTKKVTEKNIVEIIKEDDMNSHNGLVLNTSYDDYVLGANINQYLNREHWKEHHALSDIGPDNDLFYFKEGIGVWCDPDGTINTIDCDTSCVYKGIELIGLNFSVFLEIIQEEPCDEDIIYLEGKGKRGQNQHVYDFDKSGLQVWTWRNMIRTVQIYNSKNDS